MLLPWICILARGFAEINDAPRKRPVACDKSNPKCSCSRLCIVPSSPISTTRSRSDSESEIPSAGASTTCDGGSPDQGESEAGGWLHALAPWVPH